MSAVYERDGGAAALAHDRVVGALRERVQPRVQRRQHRFVVVGRRAVLREPRDEARHRAGREALERRHRGVDVGVVAVDGVDVVAQPDPRVGELQRRQLGEPARQRAGFGRVEALLEARGSRPARSAGARRSSPRRARGRGCRRARSAPCRRARGRRRTAPRSRPRRGAAPRAARARRRGSRAGRRPSSASSSGSPQLRAAQQVVASVLPRWRSETTSVRMGAV